MKTSEGKGEGSLEAPIRHPLNWKEAEFYDEKALYQELERVFDICHGCRRCVSLCQAFPTLFDLVDESATFEVDGVDKGDYMKVVDQCYLCDLCYLTKCPYVPPHEWNVDFPHLMLRAKAYKFKNEPVKTRDRILSATDTVGRLAGIPVVSSIVNASNSNSVMRKVLQKTLGVHPDANIPKYHSQQFRKTFRKKPVQEFDAQSAGRTFGRVVMFTTCYGNYNEPGLVDDLVTVLEHNQIQVRLMDAEHCCGMPKLELGDLDAIETLKNKNSPELLRHVEAGWDILMPVPSCALMFKQELPLLFADEPELEKIAAHVFDPFEYLDYRHKSGKLNIDFKTSLGKVVYHSACHQRVQRIGPKTKTILSLVPGTEIQVVERCSGHDGTYAVKQEYFAHAARIGRPVVTQIKNAKADFYTSDCPMAGRHLQNLVDDGSETVHPVSLLRKAYNI